MTTLLYGRPPAVFDPPGDAIQTSPLIPDSAALEAQDPGSADSIMIYAPPGVLERRYVLALALRALKVGGRLAGISFHSLEDRRVKRFLADRAQGCVCPPDFPVCVCGRTPAAELLTRRSVVATPGEVAANPRAKSARLRVARKLHQEDPSA